MRSPGQLRALVAPKKRLPKENPERQAKARKRQSEKHRAYLASETRKVVDERANGQCEAMISHNGQGMTVSISAPPRDLLRLPHVPYQRFAPRCWLPTTDHHHLTYARYGGNELPEDMLKVCRRCHDFLEGLKPVHRRRK